MQHLDSNVCPCRQRRRRVLKVILSNNGFALVIATTGFRRQTYVYSYCHQSSKLFESYLDGLKNA
jgi:hypothetical protein